ncbi:MAG: hypothetical protein ACE5H9_12720 [Anaerolineae bacterium]
MRSNQLTWLIPIILFILLVAGFGLASGGPGTKTTADRVEIERVQPRADAAGQAIGYKAVLVNRNSAPVWIDAALLSIDFRQLAPCYGELEAVEIYQVDFIVEREIRSRLAKRADAGERVQGSLAYSDDCTMRRWVIAVRTPVKARIAARSRAMLDLTLAVDDATLVEARSEGAALQRTAGPVREDATLAVTLQNGAILEHAFETDLALFLIQSILDKALN